MNSLYISGIERMENNGFTVLFFPHNHSLIVIFAVIISNSFYPDEKMYFKVQ